MRQHWGGPRLYPGQILPWATAGGMDVICLSCAWVWSNPKTHPEGFIYDFFRKCEDV